MGKDHGKIKERASTEKRNTHKISNRNRASEHTILKSGDWKTHSLCLTGIKRFLKKKKRNFDERIHLESGYKIRSFTL